MSFGRIFNPVEIVIYLHLYSRVTQASVILVRGERVTCKCLSLIVCKFLDYLVHNPLHWHAEIP